MPCRISLRFPAPEEPFLFLNAAFLIALLVAIWGLEQLHKVIGTMRKGRPFVAANARRLRRVAASVLAGEVLRAATLVFFDQFYARTHFTATGLRFDASFNVDFFAVFLAFVIFAIAEVFAVGTRLDEDQARAIRFSTLDALCRELNCQPSDLLEWVNEKYQSPERATPAGPAEAGHYIGCPAEADATRLVNRRRSGGTGRRG